MRGYIIFVLFWVYKCEIRVLLRLLIGYVFIEDIDLYFYIFWVKIWLNFFKFLLK